MAILIAIVLATAHACVVTGGMPPHAVLHVDDKTKIYFAPDCAEGRAGLRITTLREVRELGYNPDNECRNDGYFTLGSQSGAFALLQHFGLWPEYSHWNDDGSWKGSWTQGRRIPY